MRSKLFEEKPKTVKINGKKWLQIVPDNHGSYKIHDPLTGDELGQILFDFGDNWIYDGSQLNVYEQEEIAGLLTGHQKEMDQLLRDL
jgi:hypothetical protein